MSRRFTLFALLAAVCLLFASCGALMLKAPASNKGSLVIPLRASDRKASSPLELCTRFVFSIENASYKDTAEGTTTIEFGEIPFGTYTLTGTAYGKLSEETGAQEEIVATCKVENLVIDSPEPKAVTATFILSEATLIYFNGYSVEDEDADGNPVTIVFTGTDKTTKISETVTDTETGSTIVREFYHDVEGQNPPAKETETASDGSVTVREYTATAEGNSWLSKKTEIVENVTTVSTFAQGNTTDPTDKVVTTVAEAETTILTYDQSDMRQPASKKVVESDKTTTTEYLSSDKSKTSVVTELITAGSNKGQKTVTEYNTTSGNPMRETVTSPDNHKTISEFNTTGTTKTTYQTDWVPGSGGSSTATDPDKNHIAKEIKTLSNNQTETTSYTYDLSRSPIDENDNSFPPYTTLIIEVTDSTDTVISRKEQTYDYYDNDRPHNIVTYMIDEEGNHIGEPIAYEMYTNDVSGNPYRIAILKEGENSASYYEYMPVGLLVTSKTDGSEVFRSKGNNVFKCKCENSNYDHPSSDNIDDADIAKYLSDNYFLVGNTINTDNNIKGADADDLHFVSSEEDVQKAHTAGFKYIFKVNFDEFNSTSCFSKGSVSPENGVQYLHCVIHIEKDKCSVFWGSKYNFSTAKYINTSVNYGCAPADSDFPGNNQGI